MITRLQARRRRGFSLIEILIAILLIGILLAVAAPRLLGSRDAANNSAAQQQVNSVITAAMTEFTSRETFAGADATGLQSQVKEVELVPATTSAAMSTDTNARQVSVSATATDWYGAAQGAGQVCWFVHLSNTNADEYGYTTDGNCSANNNGSVSNWQQYGYPDAP